MDREDYISKFISSYVSCISAATGISPEVSAADYILLRKQAILEYLNRSEAAISYAEQTQKKRIIISPESNLHREKSDQGHNIKESVSMEMPTEQEELSILLGLGEED